MILKDLFLMNFACSSSITDWCIVYCFYCINQFYSHQFFMIYAIHLVYFSSSVLNADQLTAVQHIVTERSEYNPPFVIYGPFGTGKTETIAQAVMVLIKERKDFKILICAQSNR